MTPAGAPIATTAMTAAGTGGTVPEVGGPQTSIREGSTRVIRWNRAVWTARTAVTRGWPVIRGWTVVRAWTVAPPIRAGTRA